MANSVYQYGSFVLNDNINYFTLDKNFDLPIFKQTTFAIARLEGLKKTGERLDNKQIAVTVKVVGASRADLEAKLDALYQALSARQQRLTLHAEDTRYYLADAVAGQAKLQPGRVISCDVPVTFICQQPFAYAAAARTLTTAALAYAAVTGQPNVWQLPGTNNPFVVNGGGNYFSRPVLTITNFTTPNATTLSAALTAGNAYTSLSVAALPAAASSGQVFLLVSGSTIQRVTLSASALLGATSLSVTSFIANYAYPIGAFCGLDIYLQAFALSQDPDGQVIAVSGLATQQVGQNAGLIVSCDPTLANGETVLVANTSTPLAFIGAFPVMEPATTWFGLLVTCSNQPTITLQAVWTPRWLA